MDTDKEKRPETAGLQQVAVVSHSLPLSLSPSASPPVPPADRSAADAHRLLLHCVAPRPIALTSTLSPDGRPNLAPFSYFMAGGANPPSVVISPLTDRTGNPKDTLRNIEATGE